MAGRGRGINLEGLQIIGRGRGPNLPITTDTTSNIPFGSSQAPMRSSGMGALVVAASLGRGGMTRGGTRAGAHGVGRGGARDQRPLAEGLFSAKPASAKESKKGSSGQEVNLSANYFQLMQTTENAKIEFYQYRVDFFPELDDGNLRKALIKKQDLRGYLYDGASSLYVTRPLHCDPLQLKVETREGHEYEITIKKTDNIISMTDVRATQVLNLILRRMMGGLNMQLVGRNLYDAGNLVSITVNDTTDKL